jgi:mono/diheme cytochrome c family protein
MRRMPGVLALFLLLIVLSSRGPPTLRLPTNETRAPSAGVIVELPLPTVPAVELKVPPPRALAKAGGKRLAAFELGQTVAVQEGCLACHQIAGQGGPGPDLTHVGSMLSERQIERVMRHPTEPMRSFAHVSRAKFEAVAEFLSTLRR